MTAVIRPILPAEYELARALLQANDWGPRVADAAVFAQLLQQSAEALVAVQGTQVVGFLRAISDGIFNGYLSMLVVDASHRRQGIGSALVRQAMGDRPEMTWVLRAGRDEQGGLQAFYRQLGFEVSQVAMERTRRRG